jgi:hypothetical protein
MIQWVVMGALAAATTVLTRVMEALQDDDDEQNS